MRYFCIVFLQKIFFNMATSPLS
ncbi:MAG: hypothetical protein RLZZ292_2458, partial [Bacteroidota bacterium]